jgi:hypothetical protein
MATVLVTALHQLYYYSLIEVSFNWLFFSLAVTETVILIHSQALHATGLSKNQGNNIKQLLKLKNLLFYVIPSLSGSTFKL